MFEKRFGDIDKKYSDYEKAKIVILPVPFDATSTWIKGSSKGPNAIINASVNMELYDIETKYEVFKIGIHTDSPLSEEYSSDKMINDVFLRVKKHLRSDKFLVTLGGEHSVSIGVIKAFKDKFDNLTVIQLDAHADLRDKYNGSKYNHACVMSRVKEYCSIIQVGVRSMSANESINFEQDRMFFARDIISKKEWYNNVSKKATNNVYLTIDLDVLDPSVMPSTGTPVPDGLSFSDVYNFVKYIIDNHTLVGFDVVELCPNDLNRSPDFLAAKLIYMILSYQFKSTSKSHAH